MNKVVRGYKRQFWRGVAATLVATYGVVLVLAVPTYAADGNAVSLTVDTKNVELVKQDPTSDLYEAKNTLTVNTAQPSGFELTIHATSADLVNDQNSSYRIEGISAFKDESSGQELLMGINPNGWGYRVEEGYGTEFMPNGFMHTPAGTEKPSVIVDTASEHDNAGCKDKKQCTVHVTFGAAIAPNSLAAGKYSTDVTYEVVVKPAPKPKSDDWPQRTAKSNPSETCEAGNTNSSCLVDLDRNMIPVKYTGSTTNAQWTSVADPEAANSGWYDYANKQWANAITVKPEALSKYRGVSKVVDQADILGFWVYIPRYRYKVLRFSGNDPYVPAQNFTIEFENKRSTKAIPTANGTWATHPAFTFGSKELNGIWFAKFETTGTSTQPTVLPNEAHVSGFYSGMDKKMGNFYSLSKTLGVNDPQNVGGGDFTTTQNNHHLARLSSHMVNNNDWGAATYLSASKYGAGYDKVQTNSQREDRNNGNGSTYGTTGCGPQANGNTSEHGGALGTQQACSKDNPQRAYNGTLGQLASTTNNLTGIYDMSGGGWEYVAASYSSDLNNSNANKHFGSAAHPPYVNTYNIANLNSCTFDTCGGQALYETNNGTGDGNGDNQWNNQRLRMDKFSSSLPWFYRGGDYSGNAGLFYTNISNARSGNVVAFRVVLAPTTQD